MGYRVEYEPVPRYKRTVKRSSRLGTLTILSFLLFMLLVNGLNLRGKEVLQKLFIPGDAAVTGQAFSSFVEDLQMGDPFSDAAEAFCRTILEGAFDEGID